MMNNLVIHTFLIAVMVVTWTEAQSFTQNTVNVSSFLLNSGAIETNIFNAVNNDNIEELDVIPMQIRKLELFGTHPQRQAQEQQERIWTLRLKIFHAVRQFKDCAKTHHQELHSTVALPSPSPTIARAYVFPAFEAELITNALLRQQFDQYCAANETRRKNIYRVRRLTSLEETTFYSLLDMIDAVLPEQRVFVFPIFTLRVTEIFPPGDDRDALLALVPPIIPVP
jgi:hypothetical protein